MRAGASASASGKTCAATMAAGVSDGAERRKKWRCDVGLASVFSCGGSSPVPVVLAAAPLALTAWTLVVWIPKELRPVVLRSCVIAFVAYGATSRLLPVIGKKIPRAKYGCDLLKRPAREAIADGDKTVPESLGLVSGVCFVLALVVTQAFTDDYIDDHEYAAAMLSIVFAVLLGFADDILDLEWKYKYVLPPLMSLPLLSAYGGGTTVVPPRVAREWLVDASGSDGPVLSTLGAVVDGGLGLLFGGGVDPLGFGLVNLGRAYMAYMVLLAVFCTNAINIYAGVNGLEAGQTYVVGLAILCMSAVELGRASSSHHNSLDGAPVAAKNHLFAVTVMLPFVATTLALLRANWFPARVFVGDTFTNYAGMTLAVVAILGHFPLMLMGLMVPQLLNFLVSVPQLFKLAPCPRHRLPTYDDATGYLRYSKVNDRATTVPEADDRMNLTLINVALRAAGGLTEPALAAVLLAFQVACCAAAVALRFALVGRIY